MLAINGKEWSELTGTDVEDFLSSPETEESFFFEFKDDRVSPEKLINEISAFSNTYGGYIFLGISDNKDIEGCTAWTEQRIQSTIHDSITPTPSFDIKKLICQNKTVYLVKINEGAEPPYITNKGKIYERLSSSSCVVNDSSRLTQMYHKHEQQLARMERIVSIPPISADLVNNIYGYIDLGFIVTFTDTTAPIRIFEQVDLKEVAQDEIKRSPSMSLFRIGNSIIFSPGGVSTNNNKMPAHLNNFLEIMYNGSARMRVILINNDPENTTINMIFPFHCINTFSEFYKRIMKGLFPDQFVYAKKYEELTVLQQFQPIFIYEPYMVNDLPELAEQNRKFVANLAEKRAVLGVDNVLVNDRIPKTGLYTVDKRTMQKWGIEEYTAKSIIQELFQSQFVEISFPYGVK